MESIEQLKGAVIVPGSKGQELFLVPHRPKPQHSPEEWARVMGWDLLSGRKITKKGILSVYDVLLVNGNVEIFDLIKSLRRYTKAKIILLAEGTQSSLSYFSLKQKKDYIEVLNSVDAIGTLNYMFDFYRLFTDVPLFWLGVPFDVSFVSGHSRQIADREKGMWAMGSNLHSHNTIVSLFVAKKAGVRQAWMQEFAHNPSESFFSVPEMEFVKLHSPLTWFDFLKEYSKCWGAVLLSNEYTWGRFSLDFAAMGIPVVGSDRQFTQKILFPNLSFDPYCDVDFAIESVKRLEEDADFLERIVNYAQSQLAVFDIPAAKERMECLIQKIM